MARCAGALRVQMHLVMPLCGTIVWCLFIYARVLHGHVVLGPVLENGTISFFGDPFFGVLCDLWIEVVLDYHDRRSLVCLEGYAERGVMWVGWAVLWVEERLWERCSGLFWSAGWALMWFVCGL